MNTNAVERVVKRGLLIAGIAISGLMLLGCSDDDNNYNPPPVAPQGVYSVTGDGAVEVVFNGIYDRDVREYVVYRSFNDTADFQAIGSVAAQDNPNLNLIIYNFVDDAVTNGVTYYYAVAAIDFSGQRSPLSAESVYDTPRPEGVLAIYSLYTNPGLAGLHLAAATSLVGNSSPNANLVVDTMYHAFFAHMASGNDIQDVGYTQSFDEIGYAPADGWATVGELELILGHTYVIWTEDNHYAKIRVTAVNLADGYVTLQWAYQTDTGNPELVPAQPSTATSSGHTVSADNK
jgi:hypothetical protein